MKRLSALLLALALLIPLAPARAGAQAASPADTLYELGLFRGTGADEEGRPIFDLDATPSRAQALVMLIRLMGEEAAALACTDPHPFTDADEWAEPYIAYAYKMGYTNGVAPDRFGGDTDADAAMYLTFVLRAMGYRDSGDGPDFSYQTAKDFAIGVGLAEPGGGNAFTRGDIAQISRVALELPLKGSDVTLIARLADLGAVDAATAAWLGFAVALPPPPEPGEAVRIPIAAWDGGAALRSADIAARFPTAHIVWWCSMPSYWYSNDYPPEQLAYIACFILHDKTAAGDPVTLHDTDTMWLSPTAQNYYIVDSEFNILAYRDEPLTDGDAAAFIAGDGGIDGAALYRTFTARMADAMADYDTRVMTISDVGRGNGWDDNTGMAYAYPVYLDGVQTDENVYFSGISFMDKDKTWTEGSQEEYDTIFRMMATVLYMNDRTVQNGDGSYENYSFSGGMRWEYTDSEGITRYGYSLKEERPFPLFILAFDRSGHVLGRVFLPLGE